MMSIVAAREAYVVDNGETPAKYLALRGGSFVFVADIHEALHVCREFDAKVLLEPGWRYQRHQFTTAVHAEERSA